MGTYIAYDKGVIFSEVDKEEKQKKKNKENKKDKDDKEEQKNDTSNDEEPLNSSKALNNINGNTYSNPSDTEGNYGLLMNINANKKSITLSIDFGALSSSSSYDPVTEKYQITGFSKEVISTFVGDIGQEAKGITLFYIMNDQTVEYTPIFNLKFDNNNNSYYEMNYTYDQLTDGRVTNPHFVTKGNISDANGIIKLYNTDVYNGSGWRTTIGTKKDGSFYDLGTFIQ